MSGARATSRLRARLADDVVFGARCVHGHIPTAVALGRAGLDFVYLDQQHGTVSLEQITAVTAALASFPTVVLVRVPEATGTAIGRALDAGADGILAPDVADRADAARILAATRYPPHGARSWGRHGGAAAEQPRPLVLPMIESPGAVADAAAIAALDGVDALYVGRNDLALACGLAPTEAGRSTRLASAVATIRAACETARVPMATSGDVASLRTEGYRMITLGSELELLEEAVRRLRDRSAPA